MRIWLAPSAFWPHRGGVEELTLKIAQHLTSAGVEVLVITNRHPETLPAQDSVEGVDVRRMAFPAPRMDAAYMTSYYRRTRELARELAELPAPDVVHVQCASIQMPHIARWCRRTGLPFIITTQGETEMDAGRLYQRSHWMRRQLRVHSRHAKALTACSHWTAAQAASVAPRFRSAEVIPNGVDPDDWQVGPVPSEPVVCAWGRHVPQKGFDLLIDAFPEVLNRLPEAKLLIGGSGPETEKLKSSAGLGVEFVGPLDREGVKALLAKSRAAVIPSRLEPFGIVAVEALAAGRVVAYSTTGGLSEATNGLGHPFDPTDPSEIADAVVEALCAVPQPELFGERARQLSWARIAQQYLAVYERCLS